MNAVDSTRNALHPGIVLRDEFAGPKGITKYTLAPRLGLSVPKADDLLNGRLDIGEVVATKLGHVFCMPKAFWLDLQRAYDATMLRSAADALELFWSEVERLAPLWSFQRPDAGRPARATARDGDSKVWAVNFNPPAFPADDIDERAVRAIAQKLAVDLDVLRRCGWQCKSVALEVTFTNEPAMSR